MSGLYLYLKKFSRGDYLAFTPLLSISLWLRRQSQKMKMSNKRRKTIADSFALNDDQKSEIDRLYMDTIGKRIPYSWHKYYAAISGKFDANFFPEVYYSELEFMANDYSYKEVFSNKLIQHSFVKSLGLVRVPQLYAYIREGKWFDSENCLIEEDDVIKLFDSKEYVFAKPFEDSCSGMGCKMLHFQNGIECKSKKNIKETLEQFNDNYMFEEVVHCSDSVSKLHPSSVNTFRIMSYIIDGQVFTCPVVMRIGRNNEVVDNAHAGGLSVAVTDNGVIVSAAVTEYNERIDVHPNSGVKFTGYKIEGFEKVLMAVKLMHLHFMSLPILSWDITLDENDAPVFIEVNSKEQGAWLPQITHGAGLFGENTRNVLLWYKQLKSRKVR